MPVDGSDEQAFASDNPQHSHRGSYVKGTDGAGNVDDAKQAVPCAHVPHDNTAVHRTRHNDAVAPTYADAGDHADVAKHALFESKIARAVRSLEMLPYSDAAIHSTCHDVGPVIRDSAGCNRAGMHVLKQVG